MLRAASSIGASAAVIVVALAVACGHEWDTFDPRLGATSATATGAGGGVANASSSGPGASSSSIASTAETGVGGAAGSGGAGGAGGCGDTMSDAKNCGACGHDCLGGECVTGFCQPVTIGTATDPIGIVVTATEIYWADQGAGAIMIASKDGSGATVWAQQPGVRYMATDGSSLFWIAEGFIRERKLGGGPIADLVTALKLEGLNVLGDTIYFTESDMGFFSAPKLGGMITPISQGAVVYAEGVAADQAIVYWADNGGTITAYDPATLMSTDFITGEAAPAGVCAYDGVMYWTNQGTGALRSRSISGGAIQTIVSGLQLPTGVAVDDKAIYWAEHNAGVIRLLAR